MTEEELIALVAQLYDIYLTYNPRNPKISTYDLDSWAKLYGYITQAEYEAILTLADIDLP